MVVDVIRWGRGCSNLWQPRLSVSATKGATSLPRFARKMGVKVCVCEMKFEFSNFELCVRMRR